MDEPSELDIERGMSASPAAPIGAATLHQQIMNLPGESPYLSGTLPSHHYREGFRDARHAAAELVLASSPIEAAQTSARPADAQPDEWRMAVERVYITARGSAATSSIPSHWLEFMRDKLLASSPREAAQTSAPPQGKEEADRIMLMVVDFGDWRFQTGLRPNAPAKPCDLFPRISEAVHASQSTGTVGRTTATKRSELPANQCCEGRGTCGVPPDMVLVPREPTTAMLDALGDTIDAVDMDWASLHDAYAAMLAASGALQSVDGVRVPAELDRDTDGELLIDWSPAKGRMVTLSLRADGRLSYAITWDGEQTHGTAQMPAASGVIASAETQAPHAHGRAVCEDCDHRWIAVWPLGAEALECPECHSTNTDREVNDGR